MIEIKVTGREQLLQTIEKRTTLNRTKLASIAEIIRNEIENNLVRSKTFTGESVVPNAPRTVANKGHHKVFFHTGELYRSIVSQKISDATYLVFVSANRSLIASYLHFGTAKIPARPFFGIGNYTLTKIDLELQKP